MTLQWTNLVDFLFRTNVVVEERKKNLNLIARMNIVINANDVYSLICPRRLNALIECSHCPCVCSLDETPRSVNKIHAIANLHTWIYVLMRDSCTSDLPFAIYRSFLHDVRAILPTKYFYFFPHLRWIFIIHVRRELKLKNYHKRIESSNDLEQSEIFIVRKVNLIKKIENFCCEVRIFIWLLWKFSS